MRIFLPGEGDKWKKKNWEVLRREYLCQELGKGKVRPHVDFARGLCAFLKTAGT